VSENGQRYIGDVVFDGLCTEPGFKTEAEKLIRGDWRTGSDDFARYIETRVDAVLADIEEETWGTLGPFYLEGRVMATRIDRERDPWLWAYRHMVGAHISPEAARDALNRIAEEKR
jgi:hypothetical protein